MNQLYYNKTFFDANGLTPPTTWDEMEALCNKIVEIDPYSIPLGYDSEYSTSVDLLIGSVYILPSPN